MPLILVSFVQVKRDNCEAKVSFTEEDKNYTCEKYVSLQRRQPKCSYLTIACLWDIFIQRAYALLSLCLVAPSKRAYINVLDTMSTAIVFSS